MTEEPQRPNDPTEYIRQIRRAVAAVEMVEHFVRIPAEYSPYQEVKR